MSSPFISYSITPLLLRHIYASCSYPPTGECDHSSYVYDEGDLENLRKVLGSKQLWAHDTGFVGELERDFAKRIGARHSIAANAAMSLLDAAIFAAGVGAGDEVICDPIVQFHAIATLYNNAHPVFADVDPKTWLIDPASVEKRITKFTKAIVCTHLWGLPCKLDALRRIADEHDITLIEDCAHVLFSKYKGRNVGTWGHIGIFSLCGGKHVSTGDGGLATTNDEELEKRMRSMVIFGESPPELAHNYRMTELVAAVALAQLDKADGYLKLRSENYGVYDEAVKDCPWLERRTVPTDRTIEGYIWGCLFRGEEYGVGYAAFKDAAEEVGAKVDFGFTQVPAYQYALFQVPMAYGNKGCPLRRCPYYKGDHTPYDADGVRGLCPVAEDLIPRTVSTGVFAPKEVVVKNAGLLRNAIKRAERGR